MPEKALGIPDRNKFGDLRNILKSDFYDLVLQSHEAERAGKHLDLRIGNPEIGLISWAVRKGLPEPGKKHLAIRQPLHEYSYKDFSGEITEGYGKGKVETELGTILIDKVSRNKLVFTRADKRNQERYALVRTPKYGKDKWLLINITPTKYPGPTKVHYKTVDKEQALKIINNLQPGSTVSAKLDGARTIIQLLDDTVELYSERISKDKNRPIVYTEKVYEEIPEGKIPDTLKNAVLIGELIGVDSKGKAIPPNELSGLLNSTLENAVTYKRKNDIEFLIYLFDIAKLKGIDVNQLLPAEKIKLLEEIRNRLPESIKKNLRIIETVYTSDKAKKLLHKIIEKKHPLTEEGIVINPVTGKPMKFKNFEEKDVYIRAIFPGGGKYKNIAAGGFYYSYTPGGPIVGKVGTGFSDEMRKDMWLNPDVYIGRKARVQFFREGHALQHPSFIALHEG
jgi:hypothetical protein